MFKESTSFKIPATSANLGVGFDSIGIALEKYLSIEAEPAKSWSMEFLNKELEVLPQDKNNLVIKTAIETAEKFGKIIPPLAIRMGSEIPLTHGLGSSSSAIIAGIKLADHFARLDLSQNDYINIGSQLEGHPDNIGPCVTGGVFVGYYHDGKVDYQTARFDNISIIISVPPYEVSTADARRVIPQSYPKSAAVEQSAISSVMVMAMLQKDYHQMGKMMMQDQLHEPYRQPLIEEFSLIKSKALKSGAYATVISGAGPTVLTLCPEDKAQQVLQAVSEIQHCQHELVNVHYNKALPF